MPGGLALVKLVEVQSLGPFEPMTLTRHQSGVATGRANVTVYCCAVPVVILFSSRVAKAPSRATWTLKPVTPLRSGEVQLKVGMVMWAVVPARLRPVGAANAVRKVRAADQMPYCG